MTSDSITLDFDHPPAEPLPVLKSWYAEAQSLPTPNPNAMSLATVDVDGRPSVRIVLLRGLDERGAVFFTNRHSRKGRALEANPRAMLLFHWDHANRQVRIEGSATHTSEAESDAYWSGRPRDNQLSAWASNQSHPVASRQVLERALADGAARFAGKPVPRPPHWGGYRISLDSIEFWQGHAARLHDRIQYRRRGAGWEITRLAP